MRSCPKLVLLIICALAGTVFAAAKPIKDANMSVKPAVGAGEKANVPAQLTEKKSVVTKEATAPAAVPSPAAVASESGGIAVTVNGRDITEAEVDARIKPHLSRITKQMDPNVVEQYKGRIRAQMLEGMITEMLLDEQVAKAGIVITDSDVNDKIGEITTQQGMSIDSVKAMLEAQGQSFEQFKQQMKKGLGYEKLVDRQAGDVEVNDAEALAYYKENQEDYNAPEQVQASHILIKVAPSASDEEKAQAKAKAGKLLKDIKGGADFATLAKENSDDPGSKIKGGALGSFSRGDMVKPFEDVAFALKTGQVSDIVETQFGYHIIKVTGHKPAGLTPFEKVKPDIIKMLKDTKKGRLFRQYIGKLRAEAKIVYPPGKEPMPMSMRPPGQQREVEIPPAPK
ncbi:MAG: peptidylprolyl isomerase [Sedimentisphaerales bacterium]|jgi:peptidyl-prolyl cis-trans isomerase C